MVETVTGGETGFVFKSGYIDDLASVASRAHSMPQHMRAVENAAAEIDEE